MVEYLKHHWHLIRLCISKCKLECPAKYLGGTGVADKVNQLVRLVLLCLTWQHLDATEQDDILWRSLGLVLPVLVGEVYDAAEGCGKCAVVLYLTLVLIAAGFVHVGVDEGLHGIDVEDVAGDGVVGIGEDLGGQG